MLWLVLSCSLGAAPVSLPPDQAALLAQWSTQLGGRRAHESFGALVARAARLQLGKPYVETPPGGDPETLYLELRGFDCQSLVESTLAVARCTWRNDSDAACFAREVQASRYRDGRVDGFLSRLHYFEDWLADNGRRGRVRELTAELGGHPVSVPTSLMSAHQGRYPALLHADVMSDLQALEARLSKTPVSVIERDGLGRAQEKLEAGDIIAIVTTKPGVLVSHVGFMWKDERGAQHFLHASSYHEHVMLTGDVAGYVSRWPDRRGALFARPIAPETAAVATKEP